LCCSSQVHGGEVSLLWVLKYCPRSSKTAGKNKEKSKENVANLEQQMFTKCICAKILSPESAVQFLKSWNTHALDKCLLNPTKMDLTDSPFTTIKLLNSVLDFCYPTV
jgi:hypothetical protein